MLSTKEKVLNFFMKNNTQWISGDSLSKEFDVSRETIWKAINALKKQGHQIESKRSYGYHYLGTEKLSSQLIKHYQNSDLVNDIEVLDEVNSTQIYAKNIVNQSINLNQNKIVFAEKQVNGYGRRGRSFFSPAKTGLYFSLILKNDFKNLNQLGLLMTGISMAVVRALTYFYPEKNFQLKWVNDIYLNNKKIAGILTEAITELESNTSRALVIGVGINLSTIDFPTEIKNKVQSIDQNFNVDRNRLAAKIIDEIDQILTENPKNIFLPEYREKLLLMNRTVLLNVGNQDFTGKVLNVDEDGQLVMKLDNNKIRHFNSGEVTKVHF
ncbi:biotin--[acetyl-CoA-carboxylase] ligase [Lactobacillus sp. S2-2]|uniref:biotin--[acetyl-CoA-carboxylase] ligase n=1 Tax=Lactobacillus sp. S2-2 TaxID=2692917 RepID=UPI001F012827|nr:biotin--[acetyl-CoA-carboxylase] ligase [Lactobacillus sp. S2-2]MCF6515576.1 biotin--[acetyl-CoA-carboxylase] ligase [Lactobacillus sp. S2-2]